MTTVQQNGFIDNWQATKSTIKECFQFLLNNEKLADVHFIVGKDDQKQKVPAHKFILVSRSVVFETMFFSSLAITTEDEIKVPDIEPATFLAFLQFLYTDEVEINEEIVMSTLYTAKKYNVPALQQHCVNFLKTNCNVDNVFLLLTQARLFEEPDLENFCLEMIDKRSTESFASDGFVNIDLDTLIELLYRSSLIIDEFSLFKAVVRWSNAECTRNNLTITPVNQRSVLGEAFQLIRFPLMRIEDFVNGPVESGLLTDNEVVQLLKFLKGDSKPSIPFLSEPRTFSKHGIQAFPSYHQQRRGLNCFIRR